MKNNSELLTYFGLRHNATKSELTAAYKARAKDLHPDKGGPSDDFVELTKSYKALFERLPECSYCKDTGYIREGLTRRLCKCKKK